VVVEPDAEARVLFPLAWSRAGRFLMVEDDHRAEPPLNVAIGWSDAVLSR
jgi:hypothetical protein